MPIIVYIDALILATYAVGLCWVNLSVALLLTRKRQSSLPNHCLESTYLTSHIDGDAQREGYARAIGIIPPQVLLDQQHAPPRQAAPIEAEWRLPVQAGSPDQVVIHIEPDGVQTEGQRTIQRIIEHLRKMPSTTSSPEIAS
jgi:hypothetical protein